VEFHKYTHREGLESSVVLKLSFLSVNAALWWILSSPTEKELSLALVLSLLSIGQECFQYL